MYKVIQDRKLAEKEVEELLSIYRSRYSKYIGDIEAYIRSHEGKQIDYEEFIRIYNHTLTKIDSPWAGAYVINLIFFKIRIPKEWFEGEYSGTRYMEDQKYALFISLTERDKARKLEENAIKKLEETIKTNYNILKQIEASYDETKENLLRAEKKYDSDLKENKLGLLSFSNLESSRNNMYEMQKSLYEMQINYAKTLSEFNLITSGYITKLLEDGQMLNKDYEAGNSFVEKAEWYLKDTLTNYNFIFGVKIPDEYEIDSYELYYEDTIVGSRVNTEDTIIHVPLVYNDSTLMSLKLYNEDTIKYIAYFDGGNYEGELELQKAEEALSPIQDIEKNSSIGKWKLESIDAIREKLSVNINEYNYDSYIVYYKENIIERAKKDDTIETLGLYFSDIDNLKLKLLYNDKEIETLYFKKTFDKEGIIIQK